MPDEHVGQVKENYQWKVSSYVHSEIVSPLALRDVLREKL